MHPRVTFTLVPFISLRRVSMTLALWHYGLDDNVIPFRSHWLYSPIVENVYSDGMITSVKISIMNEQDDVYGTLGMSLSIIGYV